MKRQTPFNGIDLTHEEEGILLEGCKNPKPVQRLKIWFADSKVGIKRNS